MWRQLSWGGGGSIVTQTSTMIRTRIMSITQSPKCVHTIQTATWLLSFLSDPAPGRLRRGKHLRYNNSPRALQMLHSYSSQINIWWQMGNTHTRAHKQCQPYSYHASAHLNRDYHPVCGWCAAQLMTAPHTASPPRCNSTGMRVIVPCFISPTHQCCSLASTRQTPASPLCVCQPLR